MTTLSPMMQQYMKIKQEHPDHILFYRLGDFYEMFFDDAKIASKELELTLTGRDCGLEERAPMCGVPYHSCEGYIARLIKKGYKVAICEQMEDPKTAKGVVKREVIRVVTPGTLVETTMLDEGINNFIASIYLSDQEYGLAIADISTGEIHATQFEDADDGKLKNELARFAPTEVVFNPAFLSKTQMATFLKERLTCCADCLEEDNFIFEQSEKRVEAQFSGKSLEELGLSDKSLAVCAIGGLLCYLSQTQMTGIDRLVTLDLYSDTQFMMLDMIARRNLELTETMRAHEKWGSLLWVLDKTKTAMGKRLLRLYLEQPLINPAVINKRLNAVEELYQDTILRSDLQELLTHVYDLERLMTKIVFGNCSPRDMKTLEYALRQLPGIKNRMQDCKSLYLKEIYQEIDPLEDVSDLIGAAILEDPPITLKDGWVIREGFDAQLDEVRDLLTNTKDYLVGVETREKEKTGIKSLKIGYNKVFGYYLEVTKTNLSQVPDYYIRKQTLANGERYITQELKELEDKILSASEQMLVMENQLFARLREEIAAHLFRIQKTANAIARLDVFQSLAQVAMSNRYCRPQVNLSGEIEIVDGRHPVVELLMDGAPFVANSLSLNMSDRQIAIITGPNMAGKSTYMRQSALIVLMAQMGSFVPAASASIGVVDGIFTRVGASDDLTTGQSTFMMEMNEVASILKSATSRSLLILDEIGRGTSTFDGMSIARAVIEYIADKKKMGAKTLFATHYHELTELEETLPSVKNFNIAVKKRGDQITFLRKIIPGGADDSYGIEVSKLAGIPDTIIHRAFEILHSIESQQEIPMGKGRRKESVPQPDMEQTSLLSVTTSRLEEELRQVDLNTLTPIEALNLLYKLKTMI